MNDDKLILYYYDDLAGAERREVERALAGDPAVAARFRALKGDLDDFSDPRVTPPPPDMVQRWHDTIDRAAGIASPAARRPGFHSWSFLLGAAVTAALAAGIGLGILISGDEPAATRIEIPVAGLGTATPGAQPAFIRGLRLHLKESERSLASLPAETNGDRAVLIMDIIEQNRLFARAARRNDADDLARVLRAFELVLVELAAEDIAPEDAAALRAKLKFELNVMLTKLSRSSSDEPHSI
ncbi:MAG: hypothetical protein OEV41_01560 [Gammaproteobacteria bacterium]|nr:hypothetical protein [Gammaproteobacteria bacterium]MDH5344862.1 hypothetical protein [Gammaproteobacteria bacterium]